MAPNRLSFPALAVVLGAVVALWVSAGALTVASLDPGAPRLGLLSSPAWLAALLILALFVVLVARPSSRGTRVLALSALIVLPWIPLPVPNAILAWTGHLRLWLWIGIGVAIAAPRARRLLPLAIANAAADPRRAPRLAALAAACAYLAGAWQVFPRLPGGDEPHYLVIAQSLLKDGDLKIENNHQQGDYRAYFHGDLNKPDYLRRGRNGEIYSIHAPGLPAIVAPIFALFGYPGVIVALALISGCATGFAWGGAWRLTHDIGASWFGWASVALSVPFFFQSFVVFPDAPGAMLVMAAVVAMMAGRDISRRALAGAGVALALLPWLHTRFALLAGVLGALTLARQLGSSDVRRRAAALLAAPVLSAAAWFWFFYAIYGTPNPAAPYGGYTQSAIANLPRGITGLLFDQQFGLIPNAPVYLCAGVGLVSMSKRAPRLTVELLSLAIPYALAVAAYQMWWAGYSSPARFLVPIMLPLAIPAAAWFSTAGRAARVCGLGALVLSVLITGTLAIFEHGALLNNVRQDAAAKWMLWISPLVNVTTGVPSLFQNTPSMVVAQSAVWAIAVVFTCWSGAAVARRGVSAQTVATVVGFATALSGILALSIVWRTNHAQPLMPAAASIELLREYGASRGQIAIRYSPLALVALTDLPRAITLATATPSAQPGTPMIVLPRPPSGTYAIEAVIAGADARQITVTSDREFGPLWSWNVNGVRGHWRQTVTLPVSVRALLVDGDAVTRRAIDRVSIRPESVEPARARLTTLEPVLATRYGPAVVFLLDGQAYTERDGTWIGGGDTATFAIAPDPGTPIRLFVRNAPIDNEVTLTSATWREALTLKPREERFVQVPLEPGRAAALIRVTSARGSRPSDVEPGNADRRLLGCWIETR